LWEEIIKPSVPAVLNDQSMLDRVQAEVLKQIASMNDKFNKRREEENKKKAD